jgi:hypothetical protein
MCLVAELESRTLLILKPVAGNDLELVPFPVFITFFFKIRLIVFGVRLVTCSAYSMLLLFVTQKHNNRHVHR